jgi:pimeloyl-ACP methyl ester carboxylesterase
VHLRPAQGPVAAARPGRRGRAPAQAKLSGQVSSDCVAKYGDDLQHYNTEETAADLDLVRQAVGDGRLTYLGYSYGTRLGSVYAQLFPKRVRALVLDGAVDPKAGELASRRPRRPASSGRSTSSPPTARRATRPA